MHWATIWTPQTTQTTWATSACFHQTVFLQTIQVWMAAARRIQMKTPTTGTASMEASRSFPRSNTNTQPKFFWNYNKTIVRFALNLCYIIQLLHKYTWKFLSSHFKSLTKWPHFSVTFMSTEKNLNIPLLSSAWVS